VVDGVALERYRKAYPGRARAIRSLLTSEPFPPGVIAYYDGRFPAAEVKKLQEALVNAKSNERGKQTLQLLKLSSFEIAPADYDKELNAIAKSYPPPTK
jgi:ABC-type phosphate/phosphonate transport system substrate-binding protein